MTSLREPVVSVVTPVYNGGKHLGQCIESVLAQSYGTLDYVVVNNCSTDDSFEIAQSYAKRDTRLRIHNNANFMPLVQNWNHALRQISAQSKYCKVVHADDWLHVDCVSQMVDVAEKNPTVGVVGAYRHVGDKLHHSRWPFSGTVVSGREICRLHLLEWLGVFGSPTSLLLRSDLIRSHERFYNESNLHADTEACFDVLQTSDFGFVPQVLTYTRLHEHSVTTRHQSLDTMELLHYHIFQKYGAILLDRHTYKTRQRQIERRYYRFLCKSFFRDRSDAWRYHKEGLTKLGYRLSLVSLVKVFPSLVFRRFWGPAKAIRMLKGRGRLA